MATTPLLNLAGFREATLMPGPDVDALEGLEPGWLLGRLVRRTEWIYARLAKRYATPFDAADPPGAAVDWVTDLVTWDAYLKRGVNPAAMQDSEVLKRFDTAKAEVKEAADSKDGLFELPLRDASSPSGVVKGGPLGYSEASPYEWTDRQAERVSRLFR